jgi:hypothetical protein
MLGRGRELHLIVRWRLVEPRRRGKLARLGGHELGAAIARRQNPRFDRDQQARANQLTEANVEYNETL